MLSLPGIKGLIKPSDHRRSGNDRAPMGLLEQCRDNPGQSEDYLVRLAAYLDTDVLALLQISRDGKSVEIAAAGKGGFESSMAVPLLDEKGLLAKLILKDRAVGGRGKIFSTSEVFPRDAHWCDFIPMDSVVPYYFLPLAGLPGRRNQEDTARLSVVVADLAGDGPDRAMELKACAAGCLLKDWRRKEPEPGPPPIGQALEAFVTAQGHSLVVADARGRIVRTAGAVFDGLSPEALETVGQSLLALEGLQPDAGGQGLAYQVSDDLKGTLFPVQEPERPPHYVLVLNGGQKASDDNLRRELLKLLGRFTSSIAHEIKNPLTGIAAGVQYLARRLQPGVTEADTVDFILAEIGRLNRIVDDLYMVSRPPQMVMKPTAINEVVAKSLFCLSEEIVKKRLVLEQSLGQDVPCFNADPERLQQVLINVLKNAIEATPEGGRIEISTCRKDGWVRVAVADSGPGVPAADREKVFEPFYSTKHGGTGLGLCISQSIIDEHNGRMSLESPPGGGACFVMDLPTDAGGA